VTAWHIKSGRWWMLQYSWNWWLSLGIHVDLRHHPTDTPELRPAYGPYVDLHVGPAILSLGNRPVYTAVEEAQLTTCRGGRIAHE